MEYFKDYLTRLQYIKAAPKYMGEGIYTQKKKNEYKIDLQSNTYGNVLIDLAKLYGQLKLIGYKNGQKVYDQKMTLIQLICL